MGLVMTAEFISFKRIGISMAMFIVAGAACAGIRIVPQDSGVNVRLRGISATSADVAWASGREGTVLRTTDGGEHWQVIKVPDAGELDFRDVEGFDADTAVILSIGPGESSRIYRTNDGGKTWQLALHNRDPRAFFDCMAFDGERGWILGDPVDGRFQVFATDNGGRDWRLLEDGPTAMAGEAAFAGSGTCIARIGDSIVVGTGGTVSRLHFRHDDATSWRSIDSGLGQGVASAGVFSISPLPPGRDMIVVGGDYQREGSPSDAARFASVVDALGKANPEASMHQGFRRSAQQPAATAGYRSGVACQAGGDDTYCLAVGPTGVDLLRGRHWESLSDVGYDAIDLVDATGWVSGDAGRIARIEIVAGTADDASAASNADQGVRSRSPVHTP